MVTHQTLNKKESGSAAEALKSGKVPTGSAESQLDWEKFLATDFPEPRFAFETEPSSASFKPAAVDACLSTLAWERCQTTSQAIGVDPEALLASVWGILLSRVLNGAGFPVSVVMERSVPQPGRSPVQPQLLPIFVRVEESMPFRETVKRIAGELRLIRMRAHAWTAQPELASRVSALQFDCNKESGVSGAESVFRLEDFWFCLPFKIRLSIRPAPSGAGLRFYYDSGRFARTEVERLAGQYQALLDSACSDCDEPVARLNCLPAGQRRKLLEEFSQSSSKLGSGKLILDLIEQQALSRPERIAVQCGSERCTYGELWAQAEIIAQTLRSKEEKPGGFVALLFRRSRDMIAAILGTLRAGMAYVPIDPDYPAERIKHILADCGAKVLFIQRGLTLPADFTGEAWTLPEETARENLPLSRPGLDQTAYVIYTSGSTGRPKGVPITHRNLFYSTAARFEVYGKPVRAFLLLSSYAFDSSVAGLFWTLSQGGMLVMPDPQSKLDPQELSELVRRFAVSHLLCLPSLYGHLLTREDELPSLETVIVAGESCSRELVKQHFALRPSTRLFNEYGPTEATVWSTVQDCSHLPASGPVPIGRPIPGAKVYLLNPAGHPAPIWHPAEIYIGGPGLSAGYLNRPELTDAKFVDDPFSEKPAKLYRTGDLGRFLPSGEIEFLGRVDHQVKIRGFRIELEEIESVLAEAPGVLHCAVAVRDQGTDKQLVAYFTANRTEVSADACRQFLKTRLPDFMIPPIIARLDSMPLTPNGKIDRTALPNPQPAPQTAVEPPASGLETILAGIWSELLKASAVNRSDNFFELGGHSLLAIQLLAKVREKLKCSVPLRAIFDHPTLSDFAAIVAQLATKPAQSNSPIPRLDRRALPKAG